MVTQKNPYVFAQAPKAHSYPMNFMMEMVTTEQKLADSLQINGVMITNTRVVLTGSYMVEPQDPILTYL